MTRRDFKPFKPFICSWIDLTDFSIQAKIQMTQSLCCSIASLWNELDLMAKEIRLSESACSFQCRLQTYFHRRAFPVFYYSSLCFMLFPLHVVSLLSKNFIFGNNNVIINRGLRRLTGLILKTKPSDFRSYCSPLVRLEGCDRTKWSILFFVYRFFFLRRLM